MGEVIQHQEIERLPARVSNAATLTAADIKQNVRLIQEVMGSVMKRDTHYGVIFGCKQPSLYKAGSEKLLSTFRISVEPEVDDLSTADEIRYRVRAVGRHQTSGIVVGIGIGECSTNEEKYKWRRAICDAEFDDTPETRRRIKYGKYKGQVEKTKQIRTEPADLANTALKMAKKRAQIDLTLTATAASDIFTQDIEDFPEELQQEIVGAERQGRPDNRAEKYHEPKPAGEHGPLIAELEAEAGKGWPALQKMWASLSNDERVAIGGEFGRIKKIAEGAGA